MTVVGSISIQGNEIFNIFFSVPLVIAALRTQHTMPQVFSEFLANIGEQKCFLPIIGSQVASAYPAMCKIQREPKKIHYIIIS